MIRPKFIALFFNALVHCAYVMQENSEEFSTMRKILQVAENNHEWEIEEDSSGYEENEELLGVLHLRGKRSPQFAGPECDPDDNDNDMTIPIPMTMANNSDNDMTIPMTMANNSDNDNGRQRPCRPFFINPPFMLTMGELA